MKTISKISLLVALVLCVSMNGQTGKKGSQPNNASAEATPHISNDVKTNFIKDQDYLFSATASRDKKNIFGDSLKGFNETAVRADFLSRYTIGWEVQIAMNNMKREYINNKYKIGPRYTQPQAPTSGYRPGSGGNQVNLFPCVNEDFELTPPGVYNTGNAVTGWTIENGINGNPGYACGGTPAWSPGSPEFSIVATPILGTPYIAGNLFSIDNVSIPNSPLGGTNVARLNNSINGSLITRLRSTFPVTSANTLFQFAYAGSWDGSGHLCCDQPSFNIRMYNCPGAPLTCSSVNLIAGQGCGSAGSYTQSGTPFPVSWTNWVVNFIDLTPFIGTCVTIEVVNSDCNAGGHHGTAYFDARCGGALVGGGLTGVGGTTGGAVSFCAGSNQAQLQAPLGYASYQWLAPGIPPVAVSPTLGGTSTLVTIPNPIAGSVYTVNLVTSSGCSYTAVDTLNFTTVQIFGLGTNSSCPGGASGSATVQGNGSGTGYNYTWTPVGSTVAIGSTSTIAGLLPGNYNVIITGFGAAGCGADTASVTVGTSSPNIYTIFKPFCGNQAFLSSNGSNFQWYNGLTLIPGASGGTLASITVTAPYHGESYWLTYTSPYGCRDSVNFILQQTPSGSMYANNITYACPGQSNASAQIVMVPASGSPGGVNSFSVWSSSPSYASSIFPTASNTFTAAGLAAGSYSVNAFDGSCYYNSTFVVSNYVYNYNVTPTSATLCPGNTIYAGVSFTNAIVPGQFSFAWSPSTFVVGGPINTGNISIQIAPVIPVGSVVTTIYSVTVVPAIVNCPITKTISITAANLAIPTFTVPLPFCNTASIKTITFSPSGGTFSTGMGNWLNANNGNITPTLVTTAGTNTFVYTVAVSTCVVSNVGSINVSKFNTAALTGSVANQCITNPCLNLMNIVQSQVNGIWSGPGVTGTNFCPGNPLFLGGSSSTNTYVLSYNTSSNPDPNLCPDTRTLVVSVSKTVTPFIALIDPFCTNKPSFSMVANPPGGTWSGGPPQMITPAGVVNPALAQMGSNTVNYVVSTGACINNASSILIATLYRSPALSGSITNQCKGNPSINLMNIVQNPATGGTWVGPNVSGNVFTPNLSTGTYTLTYHTTSTPNPVVCPDSSKVYVHVLAPPTPTIAQPSIHCNADAPFQIMVSPNTGSFVPTVYLTAGGLFNPTLALVGNNQIQYVIGTNTCNAQDTKIINIENYVAPTLTGTLPDMCNTNNAVNLSSITQNQTGTWVGSGMIGNTFNPNISGSGAIILTYKTSSLPSGLCPAQATLAVNVYSLATPIIDDEGPFCNSKASIQLRVTPLGGVFSGENNTAVDVLGRFNPGSALIGDNIINYHVTAGPCTANAKNIIKIERFVEADFKKYAGPFCKEQEGFDLSSIVQNPGGVFTNSVGLGVENNMFIPSKANPGENNIVRYTTTSMPTASLCPDTSHIRLQVNESPVASVSSNVKQGCSPVEVVFNSPNSAGGKGEWTLGDGSSTIRGLTVAHTYTAPGTYTVVFNYWDEIGCNGHTTLENPITVFEVPKANFSYGPYGDDLTISDPQVQFNNTSTVLENNTYQWQIDNMYELNDINPSVIFPKIGKYKIDLTATTNHGCKDKISQVLEIKNDFGIYIPNSFTPNEDGMNDVFIPVFTPFGLDPKTFDMEIFDRWGTSLYRSKDVTKGWNGSIQNKGTEPLKQEVYVYKIKYKDVNGVVYNKLGYVSLVR